MDTAIRVLHVDDEPDIANLVAEFLTREDEQFEIETAENVRQGLDRLEADDVDCIVSDYDMPNQNGIEFLEAVRASHPDLPFILYTGKGSEEVASDAIAKGVTDYLQKDGGTEQYRILSNRIQNAVEQFRSRQQATVHQRINNVVEAVNEALVRATTQRDIDERVCEIIAAADPYRFAWIGEHDPDSRTVEPRNSAGIEDAYLEAVEIHSDAGPTGRGPTGQAVKTREMVVLDSIPDDPQYEPWREAALDRGYRSSAAIPLNYEDTLYGVLNVYADHTHAFDDRERHLLSNLGQTIAHAYHQIELHQQHVAQYRTLFEDAPVMLAFTRLDEGEPVIEACNRMFAERLGYTHDELLGTPLADYYSEASTQTLLDERGYQRALTGNFVREQRTLITNDGEAVRTILRASPRRNQEGEVIGTLALYVDITDEQHMKHLRRQNQRLDEFAGVVSHDLRNPLNVASGHLDLAMEDCESEHLEPIARSLRRMDTLIDDLLTLARAGETIGELESIQLAELIDTCWGNVEAESPQLFIETNATIRGDETRLQQLFENLFRNAIEHGGTQVSITVGDLPDGFYVEDDGPGIPPADQNQVMEAGYSTSANGTGFGLSIVRDIASAHGWDISVCSAAEGGARFEISNVDVAG